MKIILKLNLNISTFQMSRDLKSTVIGFKPLIGRDYDDPMIQTNISGMFNEVTKQADNSIGFRVRHFCY